MSVDNGRWTMFELTVDNGILRGKCSKWTNKTPKKIKQSFWQNLKSKRKLSATIFVLFFAVFNFVVHVEYARWKLRILIFKIGSKVFSNYTRIICILSDLWLHCTFVLSIEHCQFKRESFFTKRRERARVSSNFIFDAINFVHMHTTQFLLSRSLSIIMEKNTYTHSSSCFHNFQIELSTMNLCGLMWTIKHRTFLL